MQEKLEQKCIKFRDFTQCFIAQSSKAKELVYKGLAQCNYKEPAKGNFGDCAKVVLANLKAEEQ